MAVSETGIFEVMEVDDDTDLMLFAEDQDSNDISLHIDFANTPMNNRHNSNHNDQDHKHAEIIPLPKAQKSKRSRIEVVVRKRPMNTKEISNGETDIGKVYKDECRITICEPRLKVDLTKFTQFHEFNFDHCFDESVSNKQIYIECVKPLFNTILKPLANHKFAGKATCFGYGQTGSGKTYTLLGSEDTKTGRYDRCISS